MGTIDLTRKRETDFRIVCEGVEITAIARYIERPYKPAGFSAWMDRVVWEGDKCSYRAGQFHKQEIADIVRTITA